MRSHPAGALEDAWNRTLGAVLERRGWRPIVLCYPGYGNQTMLRVLARVVLAPPGHPQRRAPAGDRPVLVEPDRRGWRSFLTVEIARADVVITTRGPDGRVTEQTARTDRSGYLDVRVDNPGLAPGWHGVVLRTADSPPRAAPLLVVGPRARFGLVSDIDDTVIRTLLPRPLIAAYNTFVAREQARRPVPGMAALYRDLLAAHPGAPIVYVSTGPWNAAPALRRFLHRNGFPPGPLLLTDWGPTSTGWFRSGREHKRACLQALAGDLPAVRWVLFGDDGQQDPGIYAQFAAENPERVLAIAIRRLSAPEHVLAHGTVTERQGQDPDSARTAVPEVRAPDGGGLARALSRLGVR